MSHVIERFSESEWVPPWIRYQHLTRYQWVSRLTVGCKVIDAACGTGYGAALLARQGAQEVLGLDLAPEAIAEARRLHRHDALRFEVADVTRVPAADNSHDAFVSLETIEHVAGVEAFLGEVVRVLRPGGTFICSTPNRVLTNPGTRAIDRPFNVFHLREYTVGELEALLRRHFGAVRFVGQSQYARGYARTLNRIGAYFPMLAVRLHQVRKVLGMPWERPERHYPGPWSAGKEPEVLIAVCGSPRKSDPPWEGRHP